MRAMLASFAAVSALAISAPVSAEELTITLTGEVTPICGVTNDETNAAPGPIPINFGMLSDTPVGQQTDRITSRLLITCNSPDGGSVTINSENGGKLFLDGVGGEAREVGYTISSVGGFGLFFPETDLGADVVRTFPGAAQFIQGQRLTLFFKANGVAVNNDANANEADRTTVFAGNYTDVVTVSVTAN